MMHGPINIIIYHVRKLPWTSRRAEGEWEGQTSQMDGRSDEGCREVGSQTLEDQGQGRLEATSRVGQDPTWLVAPGSGVEWSRQIRTFCFQTPTVCTYDGKKIHEANTYLLTYLLHGAEAFLRS